MWMKHLRTERAEFAGGRRPWLDTGGKLANF